MPKAIFEASFGPKMSLIIICLVNSSAVFSSFSLALLLAIDSMFLSYLSRLNKPKSTSRTVIFSGNQLNLLKNTLIFEGFIGHSFILNAFQHLGLFFEELHALLSSFGERNLIVFDHKSDHFGDKLKVRNR